jgi:hypothetical protein
MLFNKTHGSTPHAGDIAFRMVDFMEGQVARGWGSALSEPSVVVCDINTSMLEVGRKRAMDRGIPDGVRAFWLVERDFSDGLCAVWLVERDIPCFSLSTSHEAFC